MRWSAPAQLPVVVAARDALLTYARRVAHTVGLGAPIFAERAQCPHVGGRKDEPRLHI